MRRSVIIGASLAIILSITVGAVYGVVHSSGIDEINYENDDLLFVSSGKTNTTTYLCYDHTGDLIEVGKESRGPELSRVSLSECSKYLKLAAISVEDRKFYSHKGVNISRSLMAMLNSVFRFKPEFGASTITQQVIKNISGDNERTLKRKLCEISRALHIERTHTKDEILELYLNIIPMSGNIYGVEAASRELFNKGARDLSLAEAATIIGITNAPSRYDPKRHSKECIDRRNVVLYAMLENGAITDEEYKSAKASPLIISGDPDYSPNVSSWFIESAKERILLDISNLYGISRSASELILSSGTKVILTMNPDIQAILEDRFSIIDPSISSQYAAVVYSSDSGDMVAIVGQSGVKSGNKLFNYATAPHPPASAIKPLSVYAPAIEKGLITMSSLIEDSPIEEYSRGEDYFPRNSPNLYEGAISVEKALAVSKNTVAVRLYSMLGGDNIFKFLRDKIGFTGLIYRENIGDRIFTDTGPSALALGQLTKGVPLTDLSHAYTAFVNQGTMRGGRMYYGVIGEDGSVILDNSSKEKRIFSKATAAIMCSIMSATCEYGTARSTRLKEIIDTGAKTGTSAGAKDKLMVGFTPYFTAGIWTNYNGAADDEHPNHLRLWDDIMISIHNDPKIVSDKYYKSFSTGGLQIYEYCTESGLLATDACRAEGTARTGYYSEGAPGYYCDRHYFE